MNARERTIALRLVELAAILALLIVSIGALAQQAGDAQFLGLPSKTFFGVVGGVLAIYVALTFSKFMFKNLPSDYEEKKEPGGESAKTLGRYSEIKYSSGKQKDPLAFDKYYTPLPKPKK